MAGMAETSPVTASTMTEYPDVTRFEVINHATQGEIFASPGSPRLAGAYGVRVTLALQDDGRTLKVFLSDR